MPLELELATYASKLPELLNEEGKFALVQGSEVVGVFGTYEDALSVGYKQFGLKPFMVQQIRSIHQAQYFSRILD
jgi:hypothetical protein